MSSIAIVRSTSFQLIETSVSRYRKLKFRISSSRADFITFPENFIFEISLLQEECVVDMANILRICFFNVPGEETNLICNN